MEKQRRPDVQPRLDLCPTGGYVPTSLDFRLPQPIVSLSLVLVWIIDSIIIVIYGLVEFTSFARQSEILLRRVPELEAENHALRQELNGTFGATPSPAEWSREVKL